MDLKDQLRQLFPDHEPEPESESGPEPEIWLQDAPILCKYEKRKGKPVTVLDGYTGADRDFAKLTRILKKEFNVGGSYKNEQILIQGDYRDRIMELLRQMGFAVKRVGG